MRNTILLLAVAVAVVVPHSEVFSPSSPTGSAPPPAAALWTPGFVPNLGQWEGGVRYTARLADTTVFLEDRGWLATFAGESGRDAVRMRFTGAGAPALAPERQRAGFENYFIGDDSTRWAADLPRYGGVRYTEMYPGIDVVAYEKDEHFEYDVVLAKGADLAAVDVCVSGAKNLRVDADGALVIETAVGPVRQPRPVTWEVDAAGERHPVPCVYELRGEDRFGFAAPSWRGETELVVDPGLMYSTFLGHTEIFAMHVDASGIVTLTGRIGRGNFTATSGAYDPTHNGFFDVFVSQLDPSLPANQQLRFSTYLGGVGGEAGTGVFVDAGGVITIAGVTESNNFPTTAAAYDTTHNGSLDAFVARFDPSKSGVQQLVYSTFLGSTGSDRADGLAVEKSGVVTIVGTTASSGFPTTSNAFDRTHNGREDAFIARFDPSRSGTQQLTYATFLGSTGPDRGYAVAVDAAGIVTLGGLTDSSSFPITAAAYQKSLNRWDDVFLARLDPAVAPTSQLLASTYLGGRGSELNNLGGQNSFALFVDAKDRVTVVGSTESIDFPTTAGALQTSLGSVSAEDAFVAQLDKHLSKLLYGTYLGGPGHEWAEAVWVGPSGIITVAGTTQAGFPTTTGAFDRTYNGGLRDGYVARLDPSRAGQQQLLYATYLGGAGFDNPYWLHVDALGITTVTGTAGSKSSNYPTTANTFQPTFVSGWGNGFVTRFDMLPTGAEIFGTSTPGCSGQLGIGVTSIPQIGNLNFALYCSNAPSNANGWVMFGARPTSPTTVLGAAVWIDLTLIELVSVRSNSEGAGNLPVPIPNLPVLVGQRLSAQFFWDGPKAPAPCPRSGIAASNALEVTVQK